MKHIYLVRHGETAANKEDIFRGRSEIPLSENGKEQAECLRRYFADIPVTEVLYSPLTRARQTAELGFPEVPRAPLETVINIDVGSWTGRPKKQIQAEDPKRWDMWLSAPESLDFPDGETLGDVRARAGLFVKSVVREQKTDLVVVSHRSVIKVILSLVLGIEQNYFWRFHLDNGSVSLLLHDEQRGWTLAKLNDTRHLKNFVFEWA